MATKKKTEPKKLGELHINVVEALEENAAIPYAVNLTTSGDLTTQTGIVSLISAVGMIIEDVIRTAVQGEFAEKLSDEARAQLEDVIILPLMDALGSQLGLIETSLDFTLKKISEGDKDAIEAIFLEQEVEEVANGDESK